MMGNNDSCICNYVSYPLIGMCLWQKERDRGLQAAGAEKSPCLWNLRRAVRTHFRQTQGKITGNALTHSENKRGVRVHSLPAATDVEVCVYLPPTNNVVCAWSPAVSRFRHRHHTGTHHYLWSDLFHPYWVCFWNLSNGKSNVTHTVQTGLIT